MEEFKDIDTGSNTPIDTYLAPQQTDLSKSNNFLVVLLSILLLIAVFIAGFFAYQTQKLVKQLMLLQATPILQTPIPSPTGNLNIYTNAKYGYTLQHPSSVTPEKQNTTDYNYYLDFVSFENTKNNTSLFSVAVSDKTLKQDVDYLKSQTDGHIEAKLTKDYTDEIAGYKAQIFEYTPIKQNTEFNAITHAVFNNGKYTYQLNIPSNIFDQVASTFKFVSSDTSSSPIACTMEAKLCPDGSAVGRSGPKCEFAPCPTVKPTAVTSPRP